MEDLINGDTIGWFVLILAFTLSMTATAKARLDAAKASKRCIGLRRWERPGADAIVSEQPRERSLQAHRAPAHGKERTPC